MAHVTDQLKASLADRCVIERELGAGGMATVFLAHDVKHNRQVALKVLRPELAAVIGAERFLKEIEVTANLQHPHILPLYDSGVIIEGSRDGAVEPAGRDPSLHPSIPPSLGLPFYVMPHIESQTLREKLAQEKQLAVEEAVEITRSVASALDYAHRQGVIHRDIKPENVLLHDGQALVADFGIALAVSDAGGSRLTETGLSIGTPHYMSPEQAMGDRWMPAATCTRWAPYSTRCWRGTRRTRAATSIGPTAASAGPPGRRTPSVPGGRSPSRSGTPRNEHRTGAGSISSSGARCTRWTSRRARPSCMARRG